MNADLLLIMRFATIFLGALVLAIALFVMAVYKKAYRESPRTPIAHVAMIAASYCLLVLLEIATISMRIRTDNPTFYHTIVAFPAFLLGVAALLRVLRYEWEMGKKK